MFVLGGYLLITLAARGMLDYFMPSEHEIRDPDACQ